MTIYTHGTLCHVQRKTVIGALFALVFIASNSQAEEIQSKGVNPADIDTRVDIINDNVRLKGGGQTNTTTFKFDKKLDDQSGFNIEMPFLININSPNYSTQGNGDLFTRYRYMIPVNGWTLGLSGEAVLPIATEPALGKNKYLIGVGGLAVKPWSRDFITAFVVKQTQSLVGYNQSLNPSANISSAANGQTNYTSSEIRFMPIFVLKDGWAIVADARQYWGQIPNSVKWTLVKVDLNKQITQNWATTIGLSKTFDALADKGALSASVKYFF
ncbi:hypothetical protein ICN42_10570 [Polynucleobacter sp. 71A-WALBACH]|uniref:hypothetical protein n=1 Tax=Polynucleobacter sp. 71A-WALBACH TaxID=2689097 RepID=UPI001C0AAFD7|nr:hypothetical protein [Polynucleobacter sp. 71A-WALBACH]MBU3594533.1 hypothetical protein [Polynucleobacter sp. 71A-WALBACH]